MTPVPEEESGAVDRRDEVVGIVIVDHGSRRGEANRRHEAFVRQWQAHRSHPIVEPAHMELAEPSIGTAVGACVAVGATLVVVSPYFLWPGNHWEHDIPQLAAEACAGHPGVRHLVTAPLGPHRLLADIVEERIDHCLSHAREAGPGCEICEGTGGCRLR